jgi:hypothetical protein
MGKDKDISVTAPIELVEEIKAYLGYGDGKAGWIREAIQQRMDRDDPDARDEPCEAPESLGESEQISVPVSQSFDERVEEHLIYGDSKAEWIREAIRQRLEREPDPETIDIPQTALEVHSD